MVDVILFNPIERFLWCIAFSILIYLGFYHFIRGIKSKSKNERIIMLGFAGFWLGIAISRIILYFSDYYLKGQYIGIDFYGDVYRTISPIYEIMLAYSYIAWFIGMISVILAFEIIRKNTKYLLSILNIFILILILAPIFPQNLYRPVVYIMQAVDLVIIIFIFIWYSKQSSQEFRQVSFFLMIGFLFMMIGNALYSALIREGGYIHPIYAPIMYITGALIILIPLIVNPKFFSHSITIHFLVLCINSILILLGLYLLYTYEFPLFYSIIFWSAIFTLILVIFYTIKRIIRLRDPQGVLAKRRHVKEKTDLLKTLTRTSPLTEEEIAFHKEQKLCLVCKGKIVRKNYMCPKCESLYCLKCSIALSNLENTCWVCETLFDESKPIKRRKELIDKEDISAQEMVAESSENIIKGDENLGGKKIS